MHLFEFYKYNIRCLWYTIRVSLDECVHRPKRAHINLSEEHIKLIKQVKLSHINEYIFILSLIYDTRSHNVDVLKWTCQVLPEPKFQSTVLVRAVTQARETAN